MLLAVYLSRDKYAIFHSLMGSGYLIKSQEDKEIMSWHVTLFTGSSFQETEYMHSLMVYICIWGHRIKWSFDGEGLQNMTPHKGLRPGPVMIFPSEGRWSHFNSPLCQWFLPTASLWSWYGSSYTGYMCREVQAGQLESEVYHCPTTYSRGTSPPFESLWGHWWCRWTIRWLLSVQVSKEDPAVKLLLPRGAAPSPAFPPFPPSRGRSALRNGSSAHSWDGSLTTGRKKSCTDTHRHTLRDLKK